MDIRGLSRYTNCPHISPSGGYILHTWGSRAVGGTYPLATRSHCAMEGELAPWGWNSELGTKPLKVWLDEIWKRAERQWIALCHQNKRQIWGIRASDPFGDRCLTHLTMSGLMLKFLGCQTTSSTSSDGLGDARKWKRLWLLATASTITHWIGVLAHDS